jgi:hypothetical protein
VWWRDKESELELNNLGQILQGKPDVIGNINTALTTKWALHIIPSLSYCWEKLRALEYFVDQIGNTIPNLDPAGFSDYLFCISNFLSPMSKYDMVWLDKRYVKSV